LFFGFFNKATDFTQKSSQDVVPAEEVPFGRYDNYIWYLYP